VLYPDFFWEGERLIGEADGREKYEDSEASVREKEREQYLRDLDFKVVRWLGKEIYLRPAVVMARVARHWGSDAPGPPEFDADLGVVGQPASGTPEYGLLWSSLGLCGRTSRWGTPDGGRFGRCGRDSRFDPPHR
jgi:hypothetical protein